MKAIEGHKEVQENKEQDIVERIKKILHREEDDQK